MVERIELDNLEMLNRLVRGVEDFSRDYGLSGKPRPYIIDGNNLVGRKHARRNAAGFLSDINKRGLGKEILLPIDAERITTKTNARIFGIKDRHGQPVTAKILLRHTGHNLTNRRQGQTLFAEIRSRSMAARALKEAGNIHVPAIFDYDRKHGKWLVEEFVQGDTATSFDLMKRADTDLAAVYGRGARLRPVFRRRNGMYWTTLLKTIDPAFPRPEEGALWPVSLVHHDLLPNLFAAKDGRICIIDWEMAQVGAVALDLSSLYRECPELGGLLIATLRRLDPERKAVSPVIQLGLGIARLARRLIEERSQYLQRLVSQKKDFATALRLYEEELKAVRKYLSHLKSAGEQMGEIY